MGRWWRVAGALALGVVVVLAGCARARGGGVISSPVATATTSETVTALPSGVTDYSASIVSGGLTRTYLVHLPPADSAGRPLPLLLALHGRLGDGRSQATLTRFNAVADRYGFIVVYPDGYQRSWADGRGSSPADKAGVDDVAFLKALLDQVEAQHKVDARRVYVTGMSNGGFMTERLGCDLAQRFAAIAIVAANFDQALAARCSPKHPMPALLIHGTLDPLVPAAGGLLNGEPILSTAATVSRWASLADCAATPTVATLPTLVNDGTSIERSTYAGCESGARVVFYNVIGGGHCWPDGLQYLPKAIIGVTSHNLDASATIWKFFAGYHL